MTRQKRELENRIDAILEFIRVDEELGCGFAPAWAYDECYEEINRLQEELAHLRHYESYMEWLMDDRWMQNLVSQHSDIQDEDELPFM